MKKRAIILVVLLVFVAAVALGGSYLDPTARSTALIPDPTSSSTQSLGRKGTFTLPTREVNRIDWSCDANDSPTFTAVPVKVQLITFNKYSTNGVELYTTQETFRYSATGAHGVHPQTKKMIFTKMSSATAATCRYWVQ